jgi:hypothetical protein
MVLTVVQRDWRIYSDATPDSGLTALAAEDTAPDLTYRYINNGTIRVRIRLAETGGTAGTNSSCTLQYSRDNATWLSLPAQDTVTGEHFLYADGMATSGGTVDTLLLTSSATAGKYFENSTTTQSIAANATGLEVDFAVKVHWPSTGTWYFRVLFAGAEAAVDTGFSHPQVTITAANRTHTVTSVGNKSTAEGLTEETRMGDQKRGWFDGTRYWYFYSVAGDTTSIHYRYWSGSGEWSAASSITGISDTTNDGRWRIWVQNISGTYTVFILAGNNQGTGVTRYLYKGTISGTTITWGSEQTITGDFGDEGNAIGVDAGNFIWVGGVTNGNGSVWARKSTSANDITAFDAAITLTDAGADETRPCYIVGLASGKALMIWYDSTDTDIHSSVITSSFAAFATVNAAATVAHDQDFGFTYDAANGFVYVACTNSITNGAGDVQLRAFSTGSETWAACTAAPTGVGNRPFGGDDHLAVQLLNSGRIACYFTGQVNGEDRHVDYLIYSGGTGGTWETNATHLSPPRLSNLDRIHTLGPGPTPDRLLAFVASGDEPNASSTVDMEWWDELITDPHPFFMRAGTLQSSTTTATVPWPAHQTGDIGLLVIETANQAVTLTTANGFAAVADSPQSTGTAGDAAATRLSVFWCRATSASMSSPITDDPGNHVIAQIYTFRRCIATGNPWDVTAGDVEATGSRTITVPGDTTTVAKALAVMIATNVVDLSAGQTHSWNNADLTDFVFVGNGNGTAGNGGGFGLACGYRPTAGAYGTTDARLVTSGQQARLTIALKPTLSGTTDTLEVPSATLELVEQVPTLLEGTNIEVPSATLTLDEHVPTLLSEIPVPSATLTLDEQVPLLAETMTVPSSTLTLTGEVPTLVSGTSLEVPSSTLTLTAHVPTLFESTTIEVPSATLELVEHAPTLLFETPVPNATLALTADVPTLLDSTPIPNATLTLDEQVPTLLEVVTVPGSTLTLTGQVPELSGGGGPVTDEIEVPSAVLTLTSVDVDTAPSLSSNEPRAAVTVTTWSQPVRLNPGDAYYFTISGTALDAPCVRLVIEYE